jgi:hypothetical protein
LKAEYDWKDKTIGYMKERLGVEEETDDDGVCKIEQGKQTATTKMMVERQGMTSKR